MQSSEKKWPVQSLSKWKHNTQTWEATQYKEGCCCLLIKDTQMLLIETKDSVTTVMESLCLIGSGGEVKAKYFDENIGISVMKSQGNMAQFFKICLANSLEKNALTNCIEVVDELKKFMIVTDHPNHTGKKSEVVVTKTLQQVMSEILDSDLSVFKDTGLDLPKECMEETFKQLIVNPEFPGLVAKITEIWDDGLK